jgi:large subunit ribosomal protein L10
LAITREKKEQMVADYVDKMSNSRALILADYRGLTVADLTDLRRRLREDSGVFQIVKNTLFRLALDQAGIPLPEEQLQGTLAVGYCLGEVPPVAKTLTDFANETDEFQVKGAILGARFLDANGVKDLGSLPPREVLLAQLVGVVQSPMSSLVSTIQAPMRELVQVLKARSEQGADGGQPAEAAA